MQSQRPPEGGIHGPAIKAMSRRLVTAMQNQGIQIGRHKGAQFDAQGRSKTGLEAEIHPYDT
ncbi:MAG: hypothetical protein HS120_07270 [Burkholderiales bacterium]|nr:hypothetical protein [Burkholderiales bacterium]